MVSVCLPSDALLQHLPSYLNFFYLGRGVSLHGCSSKAQPLLLTLDEGYLFTASVADLQPGIAPLGPPVPAQPPRDAPPSRWPWPRAWGGSSGSPPLASGTRWLLQATPDLGLGCLLPATTCLRCGVAPLSYTQCASFLWVVHSFSLY